MVKFINLITMKVEKTKKFCIKDKKILHILQITLDNIILQSKKKKKLSDDPLDSANDSTIQYSLEGMNRVSETSYEVWLHEDCIIWASNVFLVGSRIVGLDAAVWNSINHVCEICNQKGAIICCLKRDCKIAAHVPCAKENRWSLNESNLWVYCEKHASNGIESSHTPEALEKGILKRQFS